MWIFSFLSSPRLADADAELRAELREFAFDGLIQLAADLERGVVKRGTWDGCVLSYRRGYAGSVDSDRKGRRGNAFTRFWDAERIDEQHVLRFVREEIEARRAGLRPEPQRLEPVATG
ncbi:MAG: hypothetical protein DIU52_010490 [bacterium]|jgi:hypothetical protein|nr:MAG: hypothetical protein DIU52_01525 [bacterium]